MALILNSLDAILKQGTLNIKTACRQKNNFVEIAFSDTGIGIEQEDLTRRGEPFLLLKSQEKELV